MKCRSLLDFEDDSAPRSSLREYRVLPQLNAAKGAVIPTNRLVLGKGSSYDMLLEAAKKQKGAFTYDDIIPLLKEAHDWLPKESVLERYIRELCAHNLLVRLKKGVYLYNGV